MGRFSLGHWPLHITNANLPFQDEGKPLYVMQKQDGQMGLKFDAAMAAVLSWKARLDAIKGGAKATPAKRSVIRRLNTRG